MAIQRTLDTTTEWDGRASKYIVHGLCEDYTPSFWFPGHNL